MLPKAVRENKVQIPGLRKRSKIFIVKRWSDLDNYPWSPDELSYLKRQGKRSGKFHINQSGTHTFGYKITCNHPSDMEQLRLYGAEIFEIIREEVKSISVFGHQSKGLEALVEGLILSAYTFEKYLKERPSKKWKLTEVKIDDKAVDVERINHLCRSTAWARDLVNEPVSYLTAETLSSELKEKAKEAGIKVEVLRKNKIQALKMGGLLAVNRGSIDPPTFNIMEWKPENAVNKKPIVFVGKGIVYDTGGLSLKPTANSMDMMKSDMGGAASVAGAMLAAALLKLPIHLITIIPATDNRPGVNAYAPGDIITMFDGTTVEVLNTDAEGRMVLADALTYAKKYDPELVVDAATLTGSAARALGTFAMPAMGNAKVGDFKLLEAAGFESHERIVQFPFWDDYLEEMKSNIADLNNLGGPNAGMITAGKFLEHFTDYPYIHIDIAGPAFLAKKGGYRTKGGTGVGVRLLTHFLERKLKEWKKTKA
jgi:leucyl aminopeptidase